jgi:hypothetical protein
MIAAMRTIGGRLGPTPWDWAAVILLAGLFALILTTFRDYAISNDEVVQHVYGEKLLDFYRSGFADRSAFEYKNLFLYGGLFDLLAVLVAPALPYEVYETRHLLSALFGLGGIAGAWWLARSLAGPRAGLLAAVLLAVTGAWYGGMFNHTKDIPFAAGMIWALYFLTRIQAELPRPRLASVLLFGVALGVSLGLRVGGLLFILYAAVALATWFALCRWPQRPSGAVVLGEGVDVALRLVPGFLLAYALMAAFWPWSVQDPLNPLRALGDFSTFHYRIDTVLAGDVMKMYDVPGTYLPIYLAIKMPVIMLIGLVLAAGFAFADAWRRRGGRMGPGAKLTGAALAPSLTAFVAIFPVVYFFLTEPPAYDGIRHFLFVVPPLAVLAALGVDRAWAVLARRGPAELRAFASGLALLLVAHAVVLARLHPHQYVDYNPLVGGVEGAQDDYVMDYWANSLPEATDALAAYVRREFGQRPIPRPFTVAVCTERTSFEAVAPSFLRWTSNWVTADFFIAPTHMNCDTATGGTVVHEVKRLGVVLGVVKDRRGLASRATGSAKTP